MKRFAAIATLAVLLTTSATFGQQADRVPLGKLPNGAAVTFVRNGGEWGLDVSGGTSAAMSQAKPAQIQVYRAQGMTDLAAGYQSAQKDGDAVVGKAHLVDGKAAFDVEDRWKVMGTTLALERKVTVATAEENAGFYSAIRLVTSPAVKWDETQVLVPGLLYDDPAHAGGSSPAGVNPYRAKRFTIREDYLSAPMIAMSMKDNTWAAVMDLAPKGDTTVAESNGGATAIVDERIMIGAVGTRELPGGGMELGFWLPATTIETGAGGRRGEATATAGAVRGRYHPVKAGFAQNYQVGFRFDQGKSYLDVERDAWRWAWGNLKPATKLMPVNVEVARTALLDHLSSLVQTVDGRTGIPFELNSVDGSPINLTPRIIMGFCGKNLEGADQLLLEGDRDKTARGQKMRQQGLAIIDSMIRLVPMSPAPAGVGFDIQTGQAIPANFIPGFTTRMPGEDMAVLVNTYRREKAAGRDHPEWIKWAMDYCDWLLKVQHADGAFAGAWMNGTSDEIREGTTTTYVLVPVLVRISEVTGQKQYLDAAVKAAEYVWTNYGSKGVYMGATGTGNNIADKESGMLSMEAFLALYDNTKDGKWLQRAVAAANYAETWIWIWNVPMAMDADNATLHWKKGVPTIGANGIGSDGPGGVDQYLDWAAPSYAKLYQLTKDEHYLDVAYVLIHGTKAMLALPGRTYDMLGPGWNQEHWNFGPGRKGMGAHRNWLVWVSTNHLRSVMEEGFDRELFKKLSRAQPP